MFGENESTLNGASDMNEQARYLTEAQQYLNAATGKEGKPSRFGNAIVFNLLCLSIEKAITSILEAYNDLADNHTLTDLVIALERHLPMENNLRETLIHMDALQSICSVFDYYRSEPDAGDLERLADAAQQVFAMAAQVARVLSGATREMAA
jgi:hypothetical protein